MTAPVSHRRALALTPRALVSAISLCFVAAAPALAQSATQTLAPVLVTGARFSSDPALLPIGASVITAEQIRRAGAADVNQAIRKIGGVFGRQSLDGSPDFGLDLRGFGSNSNQNMVIVLDGVRMSENELVAAALSTITIDSVERIEITRGGSAVLYGDGATGGVINIITKRPAKGGRGSVFAEVGQLGQREVRASAAQTWDGFTLDAAIGTQQTDNYRDNNEFKQTNANVGAQWAIQDGRIGVRLVRSEQDYRLAGSLTLAQYDTDPRQTKTPDNFASLDSDRLTAFVERRFGAVDLAAELSRREKTARSNYIDSGFKATYTSEQTQFSPRLRHLGQFGGLLNEVVAGVDLISWNRLTDDGYAKDDSSQKSQAVYLRDEVKFDGPRNARVAVGARHERFDKDSVERLSGYTNYDFKQSLNAWELQGSFNATPLLNLFAKAGQSYRIANADENGYTSTSQPLKPQKSHDLEFGATLGGAAQSLTARLFRHKLTNEIYYDPTAGAFGGNTNLAPTKRQGLEIDASVQLAADWRVSAHLQHVKATFSEGANAGKEMALVPKNVVSARLSWVPNDGQSADVGAQWVDSQRYGSDFSNTCSSQIPSYTTIDARYARKLGAWELALSGLNLTDKQYYSNAFGCRKGIYSSDGRQLKVSARYDF
ncbi:MULTISPECIES: TonB-dependent receptor [unclassified Janthinobacterium]|uniref:TonB-dependent receptor n=1 Tax=unclassified Janthinobacterium TaxID=2610881 RepID=UPI00034CCB7F|nr:MULTISPECIES: TonB-dependent receptor [unclassified Janthinobacterium]MEC5161044.1 iron complex outermembrane receptor protein [Janthinobacterium sp. CG_S6]